MANATITGTTTADGATISNATDGAGVPGQNTSAVTVTTYHATVSGTERFYDVDFQDGNDTLVAANMPWVSPDSGASLGFDYIAMGAGDDFAHLSRSGFYSALDMGADNDTLWLDNSGGRDVLMGTGNDVVQIDMGGSAQASEEELSQKANQMPLAIDGEGGSDTLNLIGAWTVSLASGQFSLDYDHNGVADHFSSVLTSGQYADVLGMPALLSGTVRWHSPVTLSGGDTVAIEATFANFEDLNAVCFTAGSRIDTPGGPVPVEGLRRGDLVSTRTGAQPIVWIGKRHLGLTDLMANPKLLPIRVPAGALGPGRPQTDVLFSPQHRLVLRTAMAERLFGLPEVLVAAKHLIGLNGIAVAGETRSVWYWHFLTERHAVVGVAGIEAETLFPGPQALRFLGADDRADLAALFPGLIGPGPPLPPALPMLKGRDARALTARLIRAAQGAAQGATQGAAYPFGAGGV